LSKENDGSSRNPPTQTGGQGVRQTLSNAERVRELLALGPAPVLPGEDAAIYDEILTQVSAAVKPIDFIEDMFVRDITDLNWELFRLRGLKAELLILKGSAHLVDVLEAALSSDGAVEGPPKPSGRSYPKPEDTSEASSDFEGSADGDEREMAYKLVDAWRRGVVISRIDKLLASRSVTIRSIWATALIEDLDTFERIERMITTYEARRNNMLRELERHRETVGRSGTSILPKVQSAT
jgi:hypothetical protein